MFQPPPLPPKVVVEPPKPEVKENKGKTIVKKKDQVKEDGLKKNDSALEMGKVTITEKFLFIKILFCSLKILIMALCCISLFYCILYNYIIIFHINLSILHDLKKYKQLDRTAYFV